LRQSDRDIWIESGKTAIFKIIASIWKRSVYKLLYALWWKVNWFNL